MIRKSYFIYSFGCRVNEAEKVQMELNLMQNGFTVNEKTPYIALINTCAVTEKAEREARQLIYKLKKNGYSKIIITGCFATHWLKSEVNQKLPIDLCIENTNKQYTVDIILKRFYKDKISIHKNKAPFTILTQDKFLSSGRLMIKIQDGCHRFCSYCIVPYLRGKPQSESITNILSRIQNYKGKVNEVIFTAINTESFGQDTDESLTELINATFSKTSIPRISFGSIHPWSIKSDFLRWYKNLKQKDRFVHFFHIPLQSGSNKTLTLMKRGYTAEEFLWKINEIQKINPFAFIATDVIVGFLDESDTDFQQTYSFLEKSPISKFHVFRYSKRNKTAAFYMSKRLNEPTAEEKKKRSKTLIELSNQKYFEFLFKHIGRTSSALFIGNVIDGLQEVLLDNQIPAYILTNKNLNGTIHNVKIIDQKKNILIGEIV